MADTRVGIIIEAQDRATRSLQNISGSLENMQKRIEKQAEASRQFATAMGLATAAVGGFIGYGAKVAADLQTAEIGLTTLLGSAEEAGAAVERIKVEAARTPFELVGLTNAVQLLSSVTKNGDKSIDIILDIGEGLAAMGKGQAELDRIIVNLQQIGAIGYASMVDIKQFAFAGIPIFEMLQETTGKTGEALADMISNGEVTFDMLTKMFDEANNAGGRFFNAYVDQAGSFNQSMSNMKDSFAIFLATTVQSTGIFDAMTKAMGIATEFLNKHQTAIADAVKWLNEHRSVVYIVAGAIVGALVPAVYAATLAFGAWMIALAPFIVAGGALAMLIVGIKELDPIMTGLAAGILSLFIPMLVTLATTIWTVTIPAIVGMAVAFAPFLLAGAVVAGVVAGIILLVKHWDVVQAKLGELWAYITEFASGVFAVMSEWLAKVKEIWSTVLLFLKEFALNLLGLLLGSWLVILDTFFPSWQQKLQMLSDFFVGIFTTMQTFFVDLWNGIIEYFGQKLYEFVEVATPIFTAFAEYWQGVWTGVKDIFTSIWQQMKDFFGGVIDFIIEKVDKAVSYIEKLIRPLKEAAELTGGVFSSISKSVGSGFSDVINRGRGVLGLAEGGLVTRPTFAMIGEGGEPEAVIPLSKLRGMGGGSITININGGNYLDRDAARMLGDELINILRLNIRT